MRLRDEFKHLRHSYFALQFLLDRFSFETVLDIGSGAGRHAEVFEKYQKEVTRLDIGASCEFAKYRERGGSKVVMSSLEDYESLPFDCIWCSHVLEHQLNVHSFLRKARDLVKNEGVLAVTVPVAQRLIVGGHLTLWNPGLLLYNLVVAGFNCRNASVLTYDHNISVVMRVEKVDVLNRLCFDAGDIRSIREFLPQELDWKTRHNDDPFDGQIKRLNWGD